jgi:hypothetical protein
LKAGSCTYLNLQKVVELLACGREGLRSAKLKVPQLILCSEKQDNKKCKGTRRKQTSLSPHIKISLPQSAIQKGDEAISLSLTFLSFS